MFSVEVIRGTTMYRGKEVKDHCIRNEGKLGSDRHRSFKNKYYQTNSFESEMVRKVFNK